MKAILVVDIDDSYIAIKNESVILKRGTITYRDLNNNPYSIEITDFCLKPIPKKIGNVVLDTEGKPILELNSFGIGKAYINGYNHAIHDILGEEENG